MSKILKTLLMFVAGGFLFLSALGMVDMKTGLLISGFLFMVLAVLKALFTMKYGDCCQEKGKKK